MSKSEDDRAKRLAEALRQNLRRRKAQARGERGDVTHPADDNPSPEAEDERPLGPL